MAKRSAQVLWSYVPVGPDTWIWVGMPADITLDDLEVVSRTFDLWIELRVIGLEPEAIESVADYCI